MLTIRKEQMHVLSAAMRPSLVDPLAAHLRDYFPGQCEMLGDAQLRKTVELGLENAAGYGLLSEREVFLYLSVMFMLGSFFDTDPQLPWAGPILNRSTFPDGFTKVQKLYDAAMDYLDQTVGEDEEEHLKVLLRLKRLDPDHATERARSDFPAGMIGLFREIHPWKSEMLGAEGLKKLIAAGSESALRHGINGDRGRMVYLLHMFIIGSGFDKDPQFPWAEAILTDPAIPDETERVNRLYQAAMNHLNRSLKPSEG